MTGIRIWVERGSAAITEKWLTLSLTDVLIIGNAFLKFNNSLLTPIQSSIFEIFENRGNSRTAVKYRRMRTIPNLASRPNTFFTCYYAEEAKISRVISLTTFRISMDQYHMISCPLNAILLLLPTWDIGVGTPVT